MAIPLLLIPLNMESKSYSRVAGRVKAMVLSLVLTMWFANFADVLGANLSLGWDPSPDTQVVGYKVYYGVEGGSKRSVSVGKLTQASLSDLESGKTYEIYVTAYDAAGAESDPSNEVTYMVPETGLYRLAIAGFKDGYVEVFPKGLGAAGDQYSLGAPVTLKAVAKAGAVFMGWDVNGVQYSPSQVNITISGFTTATPIFKSATGTVASGPEAGGLSMSISKSNGEGYLNIGGEVGAWVLEFSNDLSNWFEAASGITSTKLPIGITTGKAFFRVRSRY